ncbi:hypothetical protein IJH29_01375 [Candidatus Saccharibacteria bacterium]|nr:hypothetical protein [Candidatus Saccharibacteria bacterium]
MYNHKKLNKSERVEVMALFGYEMTPCQPLSFKKRGESEIEVTELLRTHIRFIGTAAHHIFECMAGQKRVELEFNSTDLSWHLTVA